MFKDVSHALIGVFRSSVRFIVDGVGGIIFILIAVGFILSNVEVLHRKPPLDAFLLDLRDNCTTACA